MFAAMGRCLEQLINPVGAGAGWSLWGCEPEAVRSVEPASASLSSPFQLSANALLFVGVNMYGVFVRVLAERSQRRAFLLARNCIEDRLKLEDENEKQVGARSPFGDRGTEGGVGMGPSLEGVLEGHALVLGGGAGDPSHSGWGCWGMCPGSGLPRFGWCAGGCTLSRERLLGAQLCTDYCVGQGCPSASAGGRTHRAGAGGAGNRVLERVESGRRRSSCLGHMLGAWRGAFNLLWPQWRRLEELSVAGRAHVEGRVCDSAACREVCSRRPVRCGCGLSAEVRACRWVGRCTGRIVVFCPVQGEQRCGCCFSL